MARTSPIVTGVSTVRASDCSLIVNLHGIEENVNKIEDVGNGIFLTREVADPAKQHFVSRRGVYLPDLPKDLDEFFLPVSLLYRSAHQAFEQHYPFTVAPETTWYAIVHEVATHIRLNSTSYQSLFKASPGAKTKIEVEDNYLEWGGNNDWGRCIGLFEEPLKENLSTEFVNLFLPKFSTMTKEDEVAILLAFMDAVSEYYDFSVATLCGIPRVKVKGSVEDWSLMALHLEEVATLFPPLVKYFTEVKLIVKEVLNTLITGDADLLFWSSLYKYNSESGVNTSVSSGWLSALTAHEYHPSGARLREDFNSQIGVKGRPGGIATSWLPSHVSKVNYTWRYGASEIPMTFFAGVIGVDNDEQFITPRLGFGVAEQQGQEARMNIWGKAVFAKEFAELGALVQDGPSDE